ncbi:response regulator [Bacillus mangrovi]|uniref:Response regulator n=1 Tax=Metabacillus mangrovi TaxID=1491830 RepID=A0A7X2S4T3_9BACI|nr:LytTR family DNA-binding domain-containing protein [Metabacillus mangrovi]MTH53718.1 response regulator [Metabacillus mangrovi]
MKPFRIVIADDKPDSLEIMKHYLKKSDDFSIEAVCRDGEQLIEQIQCSSPDLILADIHMPRKNGMDAIKECLKINPDVKFIFITGYDEYAVEAFNLSAVDYIVKPVKPVRLFAALHKARSLLERASSPYSVQPRKLHVKSGSSTYYILFEDILFLEKLGRKCMIHTTKEVYETYEGIKTLYERLDQSFFLTHRSFVVNLNCVSHITPKNETYEVHFRNYQKHAYISKLKISEFNSRLSMFV